MAFLDSFELVNDRERPFITLRERSITFSKSAIELLQFSPFVYMYIDREGRRVAFQETLEDDAAIPFYREPKAGRPVLVRIADKKKTKILLDLAGVEGSEKGIRFYGEFMEKDRLICFDLSNPEIQ